MNGLNDLRTCRPGQLQTTGRNGRSVAFINARTTYILAECTLSIGESDCMFAFLGPISYYHVRLL